MNYNLSEQETIRDFFEKLCHCGSDSENDIILELLTRAENGVGKFFVKADDASERWVEFAAKVLDHFGLLSHGPNIGYCCLTDDGQLILRFLKEFGSDTGDLNGSTWPEWVFGIQFDEEISMPKDAKSKPEVEEVTLNQADNVVD